MAGPTALRHSDGLAAALLEQLRVAALAVGADSSVQLANRAARAMLDRGDVLFTDAGERVQLRCAESQRRLVLSLEEGSTGSHRRASPFLVEARKPPGPYLATVAPLAVDAAASAAWLVTLVPMNGLPPLDATLLQSLYRLSGAEAKVAASLGLGQDLTSSARELGVQPATVRAQLKAVFRKMSINRQQDLVRIATLLRLYCAGH